MDELLIKNKDVVVPGEVLATGMHYLPSFGTYRRDDKIIANRLGLATIEGKVIKTIPLAGKYIPQRNDIIIGKVIDILMTGWRVELNSPYTAVLGLKDATFEFVAKGEDLTRFYDLDDYIVAKIIQVTSQNLIDLTMKGPGLRKLHGGQIIKVNTHKVPRIIGKRGSMVWMLKFATGCRVTVGQNGLVWLDGEPEQEILAINAIKKIEDESHIPGLTERIKAYLEEQTGKKIPEQTGSEEEYSDFDSDGDGQGQGSEGQRDDRGFEPRDRDDRGPPMRNEGFGGPRGPPRGDRGPPRGGFGGGGGFGGPRGPPRGDRGPPRGGFGGGGGFGGPRGPPRNDFGPRRDAPRDAPRDAQNQDAPAGAPAQSNGGQSGSSEQFEGS